jgi:cytoskeletal protein CcmA (bactofilin family)
MENGKRGNLKISGAGSSTGGSFDEVRISGAGSIDGDIDCRILSISGAGEIKGNVKAEDVHISGAGDIKGNLECGEAEISGSGKVKGDVQCSRIKISGGSDIKGNLKSEQIEISGAIGVKGDCEAESFKASGAFDIGGLLNAGNINVNIGGYCSVSEIGGETINVRTGGGVLGIGRILSDIFNARRGMRCSIIEGDDIYLEETRAKIVRGNNVTIGKGCEIELVEYKNEINTYDERCVKEVKKVF